MQSIGYDEKNPTVYEEMCENNKFDELKKSRFKKLKKGKKITHE